MNLDFLSFFFYSSYPGKGKFRTPTKSPNKANRTSTLKKKIGRNVTIPLDSVEKWKKFDSILKDENDKETKNAFVRIIHHYRTSNK